MPRFEAHITLNKDDRSLAQRFADNDPTRWVFSEITGCPILGQGTYCYLTGYDTDGSTLRTRMEIAVGYLAIHGAGILRQKIEHIVYDTKTGINELNV